jgi:hypothetical protein
MKTAPAAVLGGGDATGTQRRSNETVIERVFGIIVAMVKFKHYHAFHFYE